MTPPHVVPHTLLLRARRIYCIGGAVQNGTASPKPIPFIQDGKTKIMHDIWKSRDGARWEKVTNSAWNCDPTLDELEHKCGVMDFMLLERENYMLTIAGDYESETTCCQDNSVWRIYPVEE